jgi:hypothetical protein
MTEKTFPPVLPHGEIEEVFPNVFFVTGTIGMPGSMPVRFSRNMTIVRQGERLVLINSVRLNDEGLRQLDKLGKVTDVIRIAGFHGMDDPFYKDHYGAKVWVVRGQKYFKGFAASSAPYFEPDETMDATSKLPLDGAKLFVFQSTKIPEGLLLLEREGGILVAGDCLQHWHKTDRYFSFLAKIMLPIMGFVKAYNVGPGWLANAKPSGDELRKVLDLPFEHVLPSHGAFVRGGAREHFRAAIERAASKPSKAS